VGAVYSLNPCDCGKTNSGGPVIVLVSVTVTGPGESGPYVGDSGPYVGDSGPYVGDSGTYVGDTGEVPGAEVSGTSPNSPG